MPSVPWRVHGGAGAWGTLSVALFGQLSLVDTGLNRSAQLLVQGLGIGVGFVWAFGVSWGGLWLLNRVLPLRVSAQAETLGLNISEHRAKTDTYDLFQVMDHQARTQDLSLRVPVEPFTEVGHIATRYNQVMANLERQHQQQVDDLEQIDYLVAIASAALDTHTFPTEDPEFVDLMERQDDIGHLARVLGQLMQTVKDREQTLTLLGQALGQLDPSMQQHILRQMLTARFGGTLPPTLDAQLNTLVNPQTLRHWWHTASTAHSLDEFQAAGLIDRQSTGEP
jgi:Amt family ammonium transporter